MGAAERGDLFQHWFIYVIAIEWDHKQNHVRCNCRNGMEFFIFNISSLLGNVLLGLYDVILQYIPIFTPNRNCAALF